MSLPTWPEPPRITATEMLSTVSFQNNLHCSIAASREQRKSILRFEKRKLVRDERPHVNRTTRNQLDRQRKIMLDVGTHTANHVRFLIKEFMNRDVESITDRQAEEDNSTVAPNQIRREIHCFFFTDGF